MPILGGLPILGRLFTSPTRDNRQIDIVISVTPRVLRAPAVTPRDEEMRPSGTLQSPTTGSLAEMIRDADREDQIAAARVLPTNVSLQLPDAPLVKPGETAVQNTTPANLPPPAGSICVLFLHPAPAKSQVNRCETQAGNVEELPSFVPAPKSLISDQAAANVATVNTGAAGTQNAVLTHCQKQPRRARHQASANTSGTTQSVACRRRDEGW